MIEERIIEWLDLGDSVLKTDIYERPKLLCFFRFNYLLLKYGITSEAADIICILIFFIQIVNLAAVNLEPKNDIILGVIKYIENIILPHKIISNSNLYIIFSSIIWALNFIHIILTILAFFLSSKKITIKILFCLISIIDLIIYYYLIGPIIYLALNGTYCPNNIHEILQVECYSNSKHLLFTILNLFFGVYSLIVIEIFSFYHNQIGSIKAFTPKKRVNCDYDIYSSNAKLLVYIIVYFYIKYAKDSVIFKYIYQFYIFLSCFFLSIYTTKKVYYYNQVINILILYFWYFDSCFAFCMVLKICFNLYDTTLLVIFGWCLIIIIFIYQHKYAHYKIITQMDFYNEQNLVYIERFVSGLIGFLYNNKKYEKMLLMGIIQRFEDFLKTNPEKNEVYTRLMNDSYMKKKFKKLNELSTLSIIYIIYIDYLEKSEIKNEITLHMCYFLMNKLKNPAFAISLITKLKVSRHSQLYYKYILMEEIKEYLINKLSKKTLQNSINHIQVGSVILYYQYMELFKIKIYDATSNQIEYFEILRNNVTSGKITENFLKIGDDILNLKKEIVRLYEKILDLNPFSNESENDYMLYIKTILQDDIMAKNEEKKYNLLKTSKFTEKNNIYYSMFKSDIDSVLLIDGYTTNGKILYATPNFPFLYKFNGKEIINTQIEELLPNYVLPFHKDLIENCLRYSNLTHIYHNTLDIFLKAKNNSLYNINAYIKPVPNLSYGIIYYTLLEKIIEHEFIITLDRDFIIDGFTQMNQGNNFTLNNNQNNNYNLSYNLICHHIGMIIPEILLQICYKDNNFYLINNNIDIKGNLYSINNAKDLEPKINIFLEIIKKRGYLNIDEETEEGRKILYEYNDFKRQINGRQSKCYSIFYKVVTKKFLNGKYRYHRLYIRNDPLSLNDNNYMDQTINISETEELNKKKAEKQITFGTFKNDNDNDEENKNNNNINNNTNLRGSFKNMNILNKNNVREIKKSIKLKVPLNKKIKKGNYMKENNIEDNKINEHNNYNEKDNNLYGNKLSKVNSLREQISIDPAGFNKIKNGIIEKKDSIQIIIMKYVSFFFVVITVILAIYDYSFSNKLYSDLVQYLKENIFFTHSKIMTSCIYMTSINIKWVKYKYINEDSCMFNCSIFYIKILEKCIKNLKTGKDSIFTFDEDYQDIILKRRKINVNIYNSNETQDIYLDVNDNLNFILSKGIKLIGSYKDYLNFYGADKINMENLVHQSYDYFKYGTQGYSGEEKSSKVLQKFNNNYLTIIIGTILCVILLGVFSYFIFYFNQIELYFLDKLINFNSPNFENYLRVLEELKKKLKNYKNEEEENNIEEMELDINSKNEGNSKIDNSKGLKEKKIKKSNAKEVEEKEKDFKNINKKRGNKQNKIQQQKIKKKKVMSFHFYKENILFAIKTSFILICFVSFFVVSFLVYKEYLKSYLEFDNATNNVENLYYESFRIFLVFKAELEKYQSKKDYNSTIPLSKDIQMPNFGNILNDLSQNSIYSKKNKDILTQLYNGDLCLLLFNNITSKDYQFCKEFLSSILLKGMEQAIIQMGVLINSVIDEINLINNESDFNYTVKGNNTNFKKYEAFIEYYLLLSYLKNEEIFNSFRIDETQHFSNLTMKIIITYFVVYLVLFVLLCYIIFMYKYLSISLFNFIAILSIKFISDDEYLYKKIIDLEKKLYK